MLPTDVEWHREGRVPRNGASRRLDSMPEPSQELRERVMSMFQNPQYCWRETFQVFFSSKNRPSCHEVESAMASLGGRYALANLQANDAGLFESASLLAPDDFSAMDICYVDDEDVPELAQQVVEELEKGDLARDERNRLSEIRQCDARIDVLHFEQVGSTRDDSEISEDLFDPSALIGVLQVLARLTQGVAVDPQSGTLV